MASVAAQVAVTALAAVCGLGAPGGPSGKAVRGIGRAPNGRRHIALVAMAFIFFAAVVHAESWSFLYESEGIKVFTDCASPPTFRAEGVLDVDVVEIFAVLADVPRRTEWVNHLSESRVVRDNHVDRVVVYSRYHLPWPARDRDSLIETSYANDYEHGTATIRFRTIKEPGEPPKSDVIRIPTATGTLYLKVLGKGKTFVRYELTLDPGGWLPQWICNFFVRDAPIEFLQAMKRRIREKKGSYQEYEHAQTRLWHVPQEK